MIPFAVWPYNDCLVAAVVAIGSERAFKLVIAVDFIGRRHTHARLAIAQAILPVDIQGWRMRFRKISVKNMDDYVK